MTGVTARNAAQQLAAPVEHDWYRIEAKAKKGTEPTSADVYVYGTIGGSWFDEGPAADQFVKDVAALDVDTINLYVNSPGGSVFDGLAMRNALIRHPANVIANVDGIAASAASYLITGGDTVVMGANSQLMIHDASSYAGGNAADLRKTASVLDSLSDNIASMYAEKAGGDKADWRALMLAETWFSADEAVTAGLADSKSSRKADDDATNSFDLSIFAFAGRDAAPAPAKLEDMAALRASFPDSTSFLDRVAAVTNERRPKRPAEPGSTTPNPTKKGVDPMADLKKEIAKRLGLPEADVANMSDETIVAALDETLAEQVTDTTTAPAATFTAPEGTVVVDSARFDEMQRQAAEGAQARAEQLKAHREGIVDKALRAGKIAAASRQQWLDNLEHNEEGTTALLDTLAEGTVLPTAEIGKTGGVDDASDSDAQVMAALGWAEADNTEGK